jgi:hypothetical protein
MGASVRTDCSSPAGGTDDGALGVHGDASDHQQQGPPADRNVQVHLIVSATTTGRGSS